MDIYQVRRRKLAELIRTDFEDNQTLFATQTGIKAPQINRWLSTTASDKRRIREDSARKIERKCGKDPGWMDVLDAEAPKAVYAVLRDDSTPIRRDALALARRLEAMPSGDKKNGLLALMRMLMIGAGAKAFEDPELVKRDVPAAANAQSKNRKKPK